VIEKAKEKFQSMLDLEAKRNRRLERVQQYYFSRAYIIIQIGRCLKISETNFSYLKPLLTAQLLSILLSNEAPSVSHLKSLQPRELLGIFNRRFRLLLDYERN
jgi:hypothetical protein